MNNKTIDKYGAVSHECCRSNVIKFFLKSKKNDLNISIIGIARAGRASKNKPVSFVGSI